MIVHDLVMQDRHSLRLRQVLALPSVGPLLVLGLFCLIFAIHTPRFWSAGNLSLIVQQSVVLGTLAIGQTLVILTAGIDLAAGSITVLATLIIGRLVAEGRDPMPCILLAFAVAALVGLVAGGLVSRWRLPPFIVTLGLLGIVTAATRLFSLGSSYPVTDDLVGWFGNAFTVAGFKVTNGVVTMLALYAGVGYTLGNTAWGRHVYATGGSLHAARLVGIDVGRILLSVYLLAALIYAMAGWLALGRIPSADPNALQTANLDSITAAVIGGASLFGGRGGVVGTLIGTLIVAVLRNGLTLAEIDPLWQDLVTGVLVIGAVAVDQLYRRGR